MAPSFLPPSPPKSPKLNDTGTSPQNSNPVLFEAFEWHSIADHKHWCRLRETLPALASIGISSIWLPPGSKAKDAESNGYDIYDAYDLGEFNQKGTVPTKWGTKQDLVHLARECKNQGMGLVWDAILNHRAFADSTETVKVVEVDPKDRRLDISQPFDIVAWTKFDYAARNGKYSTFTYNKNHFNGTDWNQRTERRAIYRFTENGKNWAQDVSNMQGNADYLMLENIDYTNQEVIDETMNWGEWILGELSLEGFRLDAVQHYSWKFANSWTQHLKNVKQGNLLCVGEYWNGDVNVLLKWLNNMSPDFQLYDVPLMYNIARLSWNRDQDLRNVFRGTLVESRPKNAVTFIRIHDTQKGQAMDTPIRRSFLPQAYSLLLLRQEGHPCVFFGDLYGISGPYPEPPTCWGKLPGIILARKLYAHGIQTDYFERSDCIGWLRSGDLQNPDGCAVVMSWAETELVHELPHLTMNVGSSHAGELWTDVLGFEWTAVEIDNQGVGKFPCQPNSMSCFVNEGAMNREMFPVRFNTDFYSKAF
ncbi:alpha amylase [Corynespora cassiicola Philippines]|uniref:Alpha amylase n=1 Tax=Corynespora cassiicola Philippines TaxID=1448308 RepID=A0A2T2N7Z9_CORCC|nr:alpha amylase [Corynespora cassiicola Philippines]